MFGVPANFSLTDPQVLYDPGVSRFVASGMAFDANSNTISYVAMTTSSDPSGTWAVYKVASPRDPAYVYDQPHLAGSTDKIAVSFFVFNCSSTCAFSTTDVYVISKADLASQSSAPAMTGISLFTFGLVPAREYSATSTVYEVAWDNGSFYLDTIDGAASSANLSGASGPISLGSGGDPPDAMQPDGGTFLNTGDDRITSAIYLNGNITWVANDACQPMQPGPTRSCLRLVVATASVFTGISQNYDIGMDGGDLFYPAIAPDGNGDLSLVFSQSSIHQYASLMGIENPSQQNRQGVLLEPGLGVYDTTSCGGRTRWGDYSGAAVDPGGSTVWVAGEYAGSATDSCDWGTAIASMYPPPKTTSISPASGPDSGGTSVVIHGTHFTGATAVAFGSVTAASYSVDSDAQITAVSPAQPVSSNPSDQLTVTTLSGVSTPTGPVPDITFNYGAPQPSVSSVAPSSGSAAGGETITITGTGLLFAQTVNVGGTQVPSSQFLSNSDTQLSFPAPTIATSATFDVTVTTAGGTSPTVNADQLTYVMPAAGIPGSWRKEVGGPGSGSAVSVAQQPVYLALHGTTLYVSDAYYGAVRALNLSTNQETIVNSAPLASPDGIAVDAAGNIYVAETSVQQVVKLDPVTGASAVIAGTGSSGISGDGGPATQAQLYFPQGVAVDGSGNIFIADGSNRVRKVDASTGIISTFAGTGVGGFSGDTGPANQAQLFEVSGLAFDANGNLFIADSGNNRIRRVDTTSPHVITTVAGNGTSGFSGDTGQAKLAELQAPYGVWIAPNGSIDIADSNNERVREVSPTGVINTVAGNGTQGFSGDGGPATAASLNMPTSAVRDASGNLYIADHLRLRRVDGSTNTITTAAGNGTACGSSGDGGSGLQAQVCQPSGLAYDGAGDLFIADTNSNRVREVKTDGTISTVAGNGTAGFAGDNGAATSAELNAPRRVAVDAAGDLFIADTGNQVVRKVSAGTITTIAGVHGVAGYNGDNQAATSAQLNNPWGIAVAADGSLYIADQSNNRIRKVSPSGTIITVAGTGTAGSTGDGGPATSALITAPMGLVLGGDGTLYFVGASNAPQLRKVDTTGTIGTLAGGVSNDVALGRNGNLIAIESTIPPTGPAYWRIDQITPAGFATVIAGQNSGGLLGQLPTAQPIGLAGDGAGQLMIADNPSTMGSPNGGGNNIYQVTLPVLPSAPERVQAMGGVGTAPLSWLQPSDGGSPVLQYTVVPSLNGVAQLPVVISGNQPSGAPPDTWRTLTSLSAGSYTFAISATTAAGTGPSASSGQVAVITAPSAPTNVQATNGGDGAATVSWSAPASDGGSAIT
ncbi:MAG TPA: IPT/TIG domain-containing protein, partial [Candidatus Dormibacteraeota bacterium]|nr:IPT/TIG domain-containing protein [Candidatus Dormibacteraeota bacterium]